MSTETFTPPPLHAINWNELCTPDPAAAAKFYGEMFGWTTEAMPGMDHYTLVKQGDRTFGGIIAPPKPGIPPHWINYVSVEDVDATVARATALGAKICLPPFDIGEAGRIAIITDPQGAAIGLHCCKK